MKRTAKSIQADIAKGAFRPHTALSTMALAYYQQDSTTLAKNMFPVSYARELYILDAQKGPFEPDDIRQCVYIEKREIMGQEYVDCKPAYCRKRWYMAGGNILYASDSRFKQITGISYPIAIHDRYEGR